MPSRPQHPLKSEMYRLSFPFGARYPWSWRNIRNLRQLAGKIHLGDDYSIKKGTKISAPLSMKLTFAGWGGSYGKLVKALTPDGRYELYFGHLEKIGIKTIGKIIRKGQVFAWGNSTGNSTANHLHFGVYDRVARSWLNPREWLSSYTYEDKQLTSGSVIDTFKRIWKRDPAPGDWKVFWQRIKLYEIISQKDLENKMLFWAHEVWGADLKTLQPDGDAAWQRHKAKYL